MSYYNHKFMVALRAISDNQENPINEWEYWGGNSGAHFTYYELLCGDEEQPERTDKCICGHVITNNCYIKHIRRGTKVVVGSDCIKKFMGGFKRLCQECGVEHRNRSISICNACRNKTKRRECTVCGLPRTGRKDAYCKVCRGGNMTCGKYKNKSFRYIYDNDELYYEWAKRVNLRGIRHWDPRITGVVYLDECIGLGHY